MDRAVGGPDAGKEREARFGDVRLKGGYYALAATADAGDAIPETDEDTNERTATARRTATIRRAGDD